MAQMTWNVGLFCILNASGDPWTYVVFGSEEAAQDYLDRYQGLNPSMNLKRHKVAPASITVRAIKAKK
jgi:hypothetical protein